MYVGRFLSYDSTVQNLS